jgi:hypothetical protein
VDIDTLGTLKHINIRKEGKSEKILAVDLKLVAEISADALIEFHPTLRSWLWDPDGNPRFNTLIDSIDLLGTLNDHAVKVNDITVSECALRKWKIEALPKNMVNVAFVASFKPPAPGVVARLADLVSERVSLRVMSENDLFAETPARNLVEDLPPGFISGETKVRVYTSDEWPFPVEKKTEEPADHAKPRRKSKKTQQEAPAP